MTKENISKVREEITRICRAVDRDIKEVDIVAVTKGRTIEEIREALEAGIQHIGENKVQEATAKFDKLLAPNSEPRTFKRHLVGHLQTNKAKEAVKIFDLIHSVDSIRLAEDINKEAARIGKTQDILIEVKTSPEATKFGFSPEETIKAIQEISRFKNLKILGLMTIAPLVDDPEEARPYFKLLRQLEDEVNASDAAPYTLHILSMGMSDDFKVAIEEGSTMVRLGRAIFGA